MTAAALVVAALSISSPSFQQNAALPEKFTCDGAGTNPALQFSGVPATAKSLALIVFDPDVPKMLKEDGRWLHWALWNLAPNAPGIAEGYGGGLSEGGGAGYVPACPPNGEHRYIFQLFALDISLGDAKIARESELRRAMDGHILEQAELVGRYSSRTSRLFTTVGLAIVAVVVLVLVYRLTKRRRRAVQSG